MIVCRERMAILTLLQPKPTCFLETGSARVSAELACYD